MKIALCGASGTGKTTLARKIALELDVPFEEYDLPDGSDKKVSLARLMAYEHFGIADPYLSTKHNMRTQFQIEGLRRKREWEVGNSNTGFVSDRSHLDWCAYGILDDINGTGSDAEYRNACYEYTADYDVLVVCLMDRFFNLGGDTVRKTSRLYHETYESILMSLITKTMVHCGGRGVRLVIPGKGDSFEDIYQQITGVRL